MSMTFEDWIRTQIEMRAQVGMSLGMADDQSHASLMTWSDKATGTWFWRVEAESVQLIQFIGADDA